eukprot:XP_001692898.1 predicted protein [Chlamydomonas reinhardtii]
MNAMTAGEQAALPMVKSLLSSPFALGQGLPPAEQCTSGSTPTPAPAARAPSLSAFSTPQPQNAGNHPTAQRAGGGAPGAVATPTPTTAVPRFHDQQQYLAAAQEAQQQQRRPPPLQLQPCVGGAGAGGACGVPLAAHASMDAPLPQQHSWGSPRSSDMQRSVSSSDTVAALMQEAQALQSGGGAAGSAHGRHSALQAGVAELEQELAGWAAAPQWQPSSQGRWYVYPPIGRKDVAPVEALVSTLTPAQAAEVAVLWRQYAAARYSAELMAGRAVRLCRELTRELANSRAHTGHVAEQGAEHAEKLGQTVAPAAAVNDYLASPTRHHASAAMAMAAPAIGAGLTPVGALRVPVPAPARPQLEVSACKAAARQQGNGATRGSMAAAAVGLLDTDDGYSYSSCSSSPGRPEDLAARLHTQHTQHAQQQGQQRAAAGPGGAEALRALAQENEELLDQLEHMRGLFLEAHADGRALREALEDVDAECAALRQHGSGLGRQAAAVLAENTSLRVEVEAAAAGGSGGTPLTAPRPPVAGMASAAAYAAGVATNTWTPPPVIGLAVPSTAAPGTGAGAGQVARTLAHALETEGAVAVVHAVPAVASSSGVGSLQLHHKQNKQVISDMNNVTTGALSAVGLGSKEQLGQYLGSWLGWGLSAVTALASQPQVATAAGAEGATSQSTSGDTAASAGQSGASQSPLADGTAAALQNPSDFALKLGVNTGGGDQGPTVAAAGAGGGMAGLPPPPPPGGLVTAFGGPADSSSYGGDGAPASNHNSNPISIPALLGQSSVPAVPQSMGSRFMVCPPCRCGGN